MGRVVEIPGVGKTHPIRIARALDLGGLRRLGTSESAIAYVKDRAGHNRRSAIDAGNARRKLGWERAVTLDQGMAATVEWYQGNSAWLDEVASGEHQAYQE